LSGRTRRLSPAESDRVARLRGLKLHADKARDCQALRRPGIATLIARLGINSSGQLGRQCWAVSEEVHLVGTSVGDTEPLAEIPKLSAQRFYAELDGGSTSSRYFGSGSPGDSWIQTYLLQQ